MEGVYSFIYSFSLASISPSLKHFAVFFGEITSKSNVYNNWTLEPQRPVSTLPGTLQNIFVGFKIQMPLECQTYTSSVEKKTLLEY